MKSTALWWTDTPPSSEGHWWYRPSPDCTESAFWVYWDDEVVGGSWMVMEDGPSGDPDEANFVENYDGQWSDRPIPLPRERVKPRSV